MSFKRNLVMFVVAIIAGVLLLDITSFADSQQTQPQAVSTSWQGKVLTSYLGTVEGPSGKETYYNLNMSGVISIMKSLGYNYEFSIREDGVKMYGPYVMCAADLTIRPRGTLVETTLGTAIVCDTGTFAQHNPTQLDIAVNW